MNESRQGHSAAVLSMEVREEEGDSAGFTGLETRELVLKGFHKKKQMRERKSDERPFDYRPRVFSPPSHVIQVTTGGLIGCYVDIYRTNISIGSTCLHL